jgi:hypothetical protein
MSIRDGQSLGVLDRVSVTVKCLLSHIHVELCCQGYQLSGRHVEISVTALFSSRSLAILHQNVCGITNKIDEFLNSLPPNAPQVICLTEHHLRAKEIRNVNLSQFTL